MLEIIAVAHLSLLNLKFLFIAEVKTVWHIHARQDEQHGGLLEDRKDRSDTVWLSGLSRFLFAQVRALMGSCTKGNARKREKLSPWRKLGWSQNRRGWARTKNCWKEMNSSRKEVVLLYYLLKLKSEGAFNSDQGDLHSARASTSKHCQPEGDPDAGCREE